MKATVLAGALASILAAGAAQAGDPVKIGMITTLSGRRLLPGHRHSRRLSSWQSKQERRHAWADSRG